MPAKTLVYGCTGFLSKAFISELRIRNMDFLTISRSEIDMTNFKSVSRFVAEEEFESIFFSVGPTPCKTLEMYSQNINLLIILLKALESVNKKIKITYVSSDAVYGSGGLGVRTEMSQPIPDTLHGSMHLSRELLLSVSGLETLILRSSAVFGLGDPHNSYGPNRFYRNIVDSNNIKLLGNGEDMRDHIWVEDFARIAVDLHLTTVGTFNVVSGNSMTFLDVAKLMISTSGVKSQIELQSSNVIVSEIKYDNGKLIGVLGYSISDSVSRGIQKFFQG